MLIMLNPYSRKNASDRGNINNVNNVKSNWGLLGQCGDGFNIINIINISRVGIIFAPHRGNVNTVNNVKSCLSKNALAGEMLIMLIMLNHIGDSWENPEMDLTLLTLLTFPLPEACFLPTWEMLIMVIMLNPFPDFPKCPPI